MLYRDGTATNILVVTLKYRKYHILATHKDSRWTIKKLTRKKNKFYHTSLATSVELSTTTDDAPVLIV
jgi:hypothetical protein